MTKSHSTRYFTMRISRATTMALQMMTTTTPKTSSTPHRGRRVTTRVGRIPPIMTNQGRMLTKSNCRSLRTHTLTASSPMLSKTPSVLRTCVMSHTRTSWTSIAAGRCSINSPSRTYSRSKEYRLSNRRYTIDGTLSSRSPTSASSPTRATR